MKLLIPLLLFSFSLFGKEARPILFNAPLELTERVSSVGKNRREIITLDPQNAPVLEEHYQHFAATLETASTQEIFQTLCHYIKHKLFDPERSTPRFVAAFVHYLGVDELPIDTFAAAGIGVCRHQVLATAYFLKRLQEEGWIKGKMALTRAEISTRYGFGPHSWCLFQEEETLWHLDPYWEIVDNASSERLITIYGKEPMERAQNTFTKKELFFFDLGGVVLRFSHDLMCENLAAYCNVPKESIAKLLFDEEIGIRFEEGTIDSQALTERLSTFCGKTLELDLLKKAASEIFSPIEETVALLKTLKSQGARLFILSNTCDAHFEYIQSHYDFIKLFDGHVLSYKVGARKPSEKIYQYALDLSGVPKEACAYIDDVKEYTEAAESLGLASHHFESADRLAPALKKWGYAPSEK